MTIVRKGLSLFVCLLFYLFLGGGGGVAVLNDLYFNMMMYLGCHVVDVFFCFCLLLLLFFFVVFLVWLSLQHGCVVFRLLS